MELTRQRHTNRIYYLSATFLLLTIFDRYIVMYKRTVHSLSQWSRITQVCMYGHYTSICLNSIFNSNNQYEFQYNNIIYI